MPVYFFTVHNGTDQIDRDGVEFADCGTVRLEAVRLAAHLLPVHAQDLIEGGDWHLDVADATGLILFRLDIQATDAPAMRPDPMLLGHVHGSSAAPAAGPRDGPTAPEKRAP